GEDKTLLPSYLYSQLATLLSVDPFVSCARSEREGRYRAGSNSSIGLPSGSSIRICLPPGPVSISLRNWIPACFKAVMHAGKSATVRMIRFHPPGPCVSPFGIARDPEAPGPLRNIC